MAEPRADIHVESSEASTMILSPLKQKILMNIQLGLICAIMTIWPVMEYLNLELCSNLDNKIISKG